jgi:hypothetical protein
VNQEGAGDNQNGNDYNMLHELFLLDKVKSSSQACSGIKKFDFWIASTMQSILLNPYIRVVKVYHGRKQKFSHFPALDV